MPTLAARFAALNPRERVFVVAGAILLVCALLYTLILGPFYAALEGRAERVARKQADLAWLHGSVAEIQALTGTMTAAPVPAEESLVVLIDRTAREGGIGNFLTGQTPSGSGGIRVRIEAAPFDTLVQWLGLLQQQYGVDIETATIDRAGSAGLVNATLTLLRAGGG